MTTMRHIPGDASRCFSAPWIEKVERRIELLWKLVNGNGEVGLFEAVRNVHEQMEALNASMERLHKKLDSVARQEDLQRLRRDFDEHVKAGAPVAYAVGFVKTMRPLWRWIIALLGTALGAGGIGAWLS